MGDWEVGIEAGVGREDLRRTRSTSFTTGGYTSVRERESVRITGKCYTALGE